MNGNAPARPNGTDVPDSGRLDDPRLTAAIEEYLALLETGEARDRREFLARYPEFSAELAACLDGRR
jgi:hypothetical protein